MQNVSSSNRSGYNALRKVYRESAEGEERLHVLGVLAFNHVKLADIFGCSESTFFKSFVGILSSCRDKGIVLESLNLIFTNEVSAKIITFFQDCSVRFLQACCISVSTTCKLYSDLYFSLVCQVRNQDAYIAISGVQIEAREIAWNWLKVLLGNLQLVFS
jgi:hypothetical protein